MRLVRIFNLVRFAAWNLRRKNPLADGRQFWQPIKELLGKHPIVAYRGWMPQGMDPALTAKLMAIEETSEINHFLRQHANIPCNDPPTLAKIVQIALNAGQLMGSTIGRDFGNAGYLGAKLYDIRTYVCFEDIREMSRDIPWEVEIALKKYLEEYCVI
jgi:hypothetical protein